MLSLIQKYLNGTASADEEKELLDWVRANESNKKAFIAHVRLWNYTQQEGYSFDEEEAFEKIRGKISLPSQKRQQPVKIGNIYGYAAALVVILFSFYFYTNGFYSNENAPNIVEKAKATEKNNDIVLISHDGTEKIIPEREEELSYLSPSEKNDPETPAYNTLKVPRGRVFRIVLSDSTTVWLNAETRIRYPEKFLTTGKTRTVSLKGEAFFEVAHNREQPFIVKSGELEIEVLGTKFNISSYDSGTHINTTLVDGSVKVSAPDEQTIPVILKPNQQAAYDKNTANMEVLRVDTDIFTAWMDQRVVFDNESFEDIVLKIERVYNVDIVNRLPEIREERFTGEFDGENMDDILKIISSSIKFNYRKEKGKIIIY